jgi:hypothetical protein
MLGKCWNGEVWLETDVFTRQNKQLIFHKLLSNLDAISDETWWETQWTDVFL